MDQNQNVTYKARFKVGQLEFEIAGDRDFVEKQMSKWESKQVDYKRTLNPEIELEEDKNGNKTLKIENMELGDFYAGKKPSSHPEKIAIFGYFFEKFEDKKKFNYEDLLSAYDQLRLRSPKNIHDVLSKTYKRNNYLLPDKDKGYWKLSAEGVRLVESLGKGGGKED